MASPLLLSLAEGLYNPSCNKPEDFFDLQVFHVYSLCSPFKPGKPLSWEESILQMQAKDQARLEYLSTLAKGNSDVPIAPDRHMLRSATYIVGAKIGTPAQTLLMALDNSNDAAWIPCSGCNGCNSTVFNTAKSKTYKTVGCKAEQCKQVPNPSCGGGRDGNGDGVCKFSFAWHFFSSCYNLVKDTITLATGPVPGYTFGCIQKATGKSVPPQGLLGLGRGPLSFLSQTKNLYKSTFSYCLPSFKSVKFSGSLRLGPKGQPQKINHTPLLKNTRRPPFYYVKMTGIRVGSKIVKIPPSALNFNTTTGAGTIFDSGTVYTRLVKPAYTIVRDEFRKQIGKNSKIISLGGFDTCYTVPIVKPPTITFIFDGLQLTLPPENILLHSTVSNVTCLAMAASPDNVNSVLNVIANWQQQNHRVLFDVPNSRLGVARELCS